MLFLYHQENVNISERIKIMIFKNERQDSALLVELNDN